MDISQFEPLWLQLIALLLGAGGFGTVILAVNGMLKARRRKQRLQERTATRMDRRSATAKRREEAAIHHREVAAANLQAANAERRATQQTLRSIDIVARLLHQHYSDVLSGAVLAPERGTVPSGHSPESQQDD